jgi:hypothetical protein
MSLSMGSRIADSQNHAGSHCHVRVRNSPENASTVLDLWVHEIEGR